MDHQSFHTLVVKNAEDLFAYGQCQGATGRKAPCPGWPRAAALAEGHQIASLLRLMGLDPDRPTLESWVKMVDRNNSGQLNLPDTLHLLLNAHAARGSLPVPMDELRRAFWLLDEEETGPGPPAGRPAGAPVG